MTRVDRVMTLSLVTLFVGGLALASGWVVPPQLPALPHAAFARAWPWAAALLSVAVGVGVVAGSLVLLRRALRRAHDQGWRQGNDHARRDLLREVQLLEHAHLKSAISVAQQQLLHAQAAQDPDQRILVLHDLDQSLTRLMQVASDLHQAVEIAERTVSALPTNLEHTIHEVCQNLRRLGTVPVQALVEGQPRTDLPRAVVVALELTLYNALANVQRHSQATSATVVLQYQAEGIALTVSDNGCGFDPAHVRRGARGLTDLGTVSRQRGGRCTVSSTRGVGTTVEAWLPLPPVAAAAVVPSRRAPPWKPASPVKGRRR